MTQNYLIDLNVTFHDKDYVFSPDKYHMPIPDMFSTRAMSVVTDANGVDFFVMEETLALSQNLTHISFKLVQAPENHGCPKANLLDYDPDKLELHFHYEWQDPRPAYLRDGGLRIAPNLQPSPRRRRWYNPLTWLRS